MILGLAVPTRSYAAAFAACGVVVARAATPAEQSSPEEHFAEVCALPRDTTVSLLAGTKKLKGVFAGCDDYQGEKVARIMVQKKSEGGGTYLIRAADALRVEILTETHVKLPKKQSGKLLPQMTPFVTHFVGYDKAMSFARHSRLECVITGRINALRREIIDTEFAVSTQEGTHQEGRLQDLLQVRKFLNESEPYRSDIYRLNTSGHMFANNGVVPPFVIFDGATGFIRWREFARSSNWLVILDWTDARFREATEILKEAHMNRIGEYKIAGLPSPPTGVEVLDFYERRS
jgi:hypothetical protein